MKNPWLKFYPSDWRSDEELRNCSIAARGLWIELLCIMHKSGGYLLINEKPPSDEQLSMQVAVPVDQLKTLILELENENVFSRNKARIIYSRKMVRGENKARISRENGKMGGNPTLCSENEIQAQDNPQKLEARNQKLETRKKNKYFDEWWMIYPRKIGKGTAEKAYAKADLPPDILEITRRYAASRQGEDQTFTPHPATWLNRKSWLDEEPEKQKKSGYVGLFG
jgi:hypothetical protein